MAAEALRLSGKPLSEYAEGPGGAPLDARRACSLDTKTMLAWARVPLPKLYAGPRVFLMPPGCGPGGQSVRACKSLQKNAGRGLGFPGLELVWELV